MSERLNVILNGEIVQANPGETILALARRNDIEIPTLCNDPRLEPFTSCYVCVVEIEGMRGLQPSCSTKVAEGMKIETYNDKVKKARKTALDLMLSNHYADCLGPCTQACPAGVDVQGYISLIDKGQYNEAVAVIKETNPLPAICGRVCVRPCEVACRRNLLDDGAAVGIDYMKRFAADYDLQSENKFKPEIQPSTGKKVAVIGAGPGGLSAGFFLQKEGHQADIYEAAPKAGGWLRYGIPEYRLPNDLLQKEVDNITEMGVNIFYNQKLGDNLKYSELQKKYDAVILTIGSQKGTLIGCEGDDAENVFSGIEFLKNMEMSGKKEDFRGKKVAVVGGGNTAMDCCRTARRCGSEEVYVIYRRTEKEMPANPIEIHESKLEGVQYLFLTNPSKVNKDENGKLKSITCLKMELGEPDASGRRRPVPKEGSEFDLEVDYILAAIGQKTIVNFLEEVNENVKDGELKITRWGDIEADPKTLQTGIKNMFAAGDGVTGPATLIEAVAQAKIASRSCNLFLQGKEVKPFGKAFISKKDNFKPQVNEEYMGKFIPQKREEMPTLDPSKRMNFCEVELGYDSEEVARQEAQRCLECGCTEVFTCDLKKYSTEYGVDQVKFAGDFKEYEVDFRHPYIEIDSNKCILCARCIRICNEVVGAIALGLVNRGFDTYVAPSMGDKLQESNCESCGLCISTCPTGAITENVFFKPGPVKLEDAKTICNYCSVGCEINVKHRNEFVMKVEGSEGMINTDGNICRYAKFGYQYLNDKSRLTQPMLKVNGKFEPISFEEAAKIMAERISKVKADDNIFFAGARLSNEEQYLVQKLARAGAKTNNVSSFHYLNEQKGYLENSMANVPFEQIMDASKIYLLGSEINKDNAVVGFMINNAQFLKKTPVDLITVHADSSMKRKANKTIIIKSYYHFVKAVNHYLLSNGLENGMFIKDRCEGFEAYKATTLKENYTLLVEKSGVCCQDTIAEFARDYNNEMNAVLVFSEKELSAHACTEVLNLAMITGKLGKTASGLIPLKEKNNAQGIFDMGAIPAYGVGTQCIKDDAFVAKMKSVWGVTTLAENLRNCMLGAMKEGAYKNLFIFAEDPVGCAIDKAEVNAWLEKAEFVAVQDYFMTETAMAADLVIPATLPLEMDGSYSNAQKVFQEFEAQFAPKLEKQSFEQTADLLELLGVKGDKEVMDIRAEALSLLATEIEDEAYQFTYTEVDSNYNRLFNYGCDAVHLRFETDFENAFRD
ncbi:MAG: FAD-dependent oxidoreductase [Bacteroidetes bacterium]|nr:FAD-dependent oxidoreductase [Bacteroidota bacterium]